jgi:hypothetical protein
MINNGTLAMLKAGTITNSGTTTGVGVVSMLTAGTVSMINNGTLSSSGTTTGVGTITNQGSVTNVGQIYNAGTVQNQLGGTLDMVKAGTITNILGGTVKLDGRIGRNILSYGTTFGGTAAAYGTLVGSAAVGAGTSLWVNDVSLVNQAGTITCLVGFGTALNGTSVIAKGQFSAGAGMEKSFPLPVNSGMTNQDLVCYVSTAGTVDVNVSYFISS